MNILQCNTCCFCLPLRPGLIVWGYFKIIADVLITLFFTYLSFVMIVLYLDDETRRYSMLLYLVVVIFDIIFLIVMDFVASIVLIIAGLKKNVRLLRGYYVYSIVMLMLSVSIIVVAVVITIVYGLCDNGHETRCSGTFVTIFVNLVVQVYVILLLRSEIIKLKARALVQLKFVNNSAAAQCMLTSGLNEADHQIITVPANCPN